MPVLLQTTLLLICSNVFVPFAVLHRKQPLKLNYLVGRPVYLCGGLLRVSGVSSSCTFRL